MSNDVWVRSGPSKYYHTEKDCDRINDDYVPKDLNVIHPDYEECAWCAGTVDVGGPTGPKLADVLRERGGE